MTSFRLSAAGASDVGRRRAANEDAFAIVEPRRLFIVSDGMGSHNAGAVAARVVTGVLPLLVQSPTTAEDLCTAIAELSERLRSESTGHPGLHGMGATVVVALCAERSALIGHLGDSRAYLFRNGQLARLTEDHSVVGILIRMGEIDSMNAADHPAHGQISRFVGMEPPALPEVRAIELAAGDRLLLCTDGLTGMLADVALAAMLAEARPPDACCAALIDAANAAGGEDNITAVVVDVAEGEPVP